MDALVILDGSGPGAQRAVHATELALELARSEDVNVRVYLLGSAVLLARTSIDDGRARLPTSPIGRLVSAGIEVAVSEADLSVLGIADDDLVLGVTPATAGILAAWTLTAERVLVF